MNQSLIDVFVEGAKKGLHINLTSMLPNLVMAFVLIQFLKITGVLTLLSKVFAPFMGIFGLPGEGIMVLFSAWLSMGGGVGAAASLFVDGTLDARHISILIPAIFLMGAQAQYMGRCLGTANIPSKFYPPLLLISIVNALLAMLVMRFLA